MEGSVCNSFKAAYQMLIPLLVTDLFKPGEYNIICPNIIFCQFQEIFFCHTRIYCSSVTHPSLASLTQLAYLYSTPLVTFNDGFFHCFLRSAMISSLTFNVIFFVATS